MQETRRATVLAASTRKAEEKTRTIEEEEKRPGAACEIADSKNPDGGSDDTP